MNQHNDSNKSQKTKAYEFESFVEDFNQLTPDNRMAALIKLFELAGEES